MSELSIISYIKESCESLIQALVEEKINKYNLKKGNTPQEYETLLIKLEKEIRSHIQIEQQLKLFIESLQNNFEDLEKENIILKSENDGMRKRIQTYEYQINSLKNEIKELEKTMAENKFSKRVFFVSYTYLSMPMNGNITIEKDINGNFCFIIENRTSTRKMSFLDVDVSIDPNYKNKIIVNLYKSGTKEEYTTSEAKVLVDTFNEFKKRVIEISDVGSETKSIHDNNEKVNKAQQKINNFFNII